MVMAMLKVEWMLWAFGYEKNVKIWAVGSLWKKLDDSQHLLHDETKDTSGQEIDDDLLNELEGLRNVTNNKQEDTNRLTEELAALREKVAKLQEGEGALVKLQSELEASEKRRSDLEKEKGELEEKLRALERNVVELESLQEKVRLLDQEKDELAHKLKEQMEQYEEMRSNLEKERDSLAKERDELKKEQDELKQEQDKLTKMYEALQNENTEEKRKYAAEVASLRENLQRTMQEKDILAQKSREESDINRSNSINLKKERDELKELIKMLENSKKVEEKEKKRLHEEIDCLRGVLQKMKQDKESRDIRHKNMLIEKV
jgi:chromosome segregation ATPase